MPAHMSAATRGRLGWLTLAVVVLLGAGGAASTPEGWQWGLAHPVAWAAILAGALVAARRWPEAGAPGLGLLPVLVLGLLGLPLPGARALTGGPLFALAAACGLLILPRTARGPAVLERAFLPVVGLACCIGSFQVQRQVGAEGDEPHYLMVAESLLHDGDLALDQDYTQDRYGAFSRKPLEPHYRVRGKDGRIYSLHALGLSLLLLPAYALGGYVGASLFMVALAVLLAREMRGLLHDVVGDREAANVAAFVVALSPPLVSYAGLVFTEIPAALGAAVVLRHGRKAEALSARATAGLGLVLAFLPWLNVRYAALSLILALYVLAQRPGWRRTGWLLFAPAASAAALLASHQVLSGFLDPRRVYGRRPEFALATLREGLPGLLLDQEFGLLVYAPVFALATAGVGAVWRRDRRLAVAGLSMVAVVLATAGTWHMWRGGFNPPARFLVPIVPVLALGLAAALARGVTAPAALLAGWGLWLGAVGVVEPRLLHRDRDGTAPLFRAVSGAEEWTRLLPGFVLEDPERRRLATVWALALGATLVWRGRGTPRGLAAASMGLLAATGTASHLATARTLGRDAVRVVGRAAVLVPGLRPVASAVGRWGPEALAWGPVYEPHRFPAGAALAERLRLPAGSFELHVRAQVLDEAPGPPALVVEGARLAPSTFERNPAGYIVRFRLETPALDLTLRLRGGGAFVLEGLQLGLQPSGPGPV
jgi:hypothetical protein